MTASSSLHQQILKEAHRFFTEQVAFRRRLHQNPELSNEEFETTKTITAAVKKLGFKFRPVKFPTGVLAELIVRKGGPWIAVRTDIDALPVTEMTGLPFKSKNVGRMHACGHDMHMAAVYGTAVLLSRFRDRLKGNVRFIFQPAEEMPPGGARPMIASGALDGVGAILGLHVDPGIPTGKIGLRDGLTMASVTDFDLVVRGKAGHAARPHTGVDAIVTAAEIVDSIQKIVARETDPIAPVAITFGKIEGGVARNVIANEVRLVGTARTLSEVAAKNVAKQIKRTAEGVARARGAKVEMKLIADYPVLKNDPRVNRLLARNAEKLIGKSKITEIKQGLGGEDFACYLEKVPGAMFRLGTMNKKIKAVEPWHSARFIADENALPIGTALLTAAVIDFLEGGF